MWEVYEVIQVVLLALELEAHNLLGAKMEYSRFGQQQELFTNGLESW